MDWLEEWIKDHSILALILGAILLLCFAWGMTLLIAPITKDISYRKAERRDIDELKQQLDRIEDFLKNEKQK